MYKPVELALEEYLENILEVVVVVEVLGGREVEGLLEGIVDEAQLNDRGPTFRQSTTNSLSLSSSIVPISMT